jgi:ABC-2 type transport system permease protein
MNGSFAAELLVLRRRASTWILLAIWAALSLLYGYLLPYITYRNNVAGPGRALPVELLPRQLVGNLIGGFPFYGGAIVLILGVLSFGSEYGWGTFKTLFTQRPGRLQVFAAKLLALALALVPFAVVTFALGAVASLLIARQEQAAVVWPPLSLLARGLLVAWLILAVWSAFGVMLAVLSRGIALAIGIGILYALAVEGLLSAFVNQVSLLRPLIKGFLRTNTYSLVKPLSTSVAASAAGPGAFGGPFVGSGQALLLLLAYLCLFLLVAAGLIRGRDVT